MNEIDTIVETLTADANSDNPVPEDPRACLRAADENGLLYPFSRKVGTNQLPADYQQRVGDLEKDIETLRETIRRIDRVSETAGIDYALIKDANSVKHVPRDVDILVHPADKNTFVQTATEFEFDYDHEGDIETTLTGEGVFPVDLYTNIIYFGVEFLPPKYLLSSRVDKQAFDVEYEGLSTEAALLVTLVHGVFGHRRFTLLDYLHMRNLVDGGVDVDACRDVTSEFGWGDTFDGFLGILERMTSSVEQPEGDIQFPYVIPYGRMMGFIRSIDGLELTRKRHTAITFSLLLDGMKIRVENSRLHEPIRQCEPLRKFLLAIAYHSRRGRGDRYS